MELLNYYVQKMLPKFIQLSIKQTLLFLSQGFKSPCLELTGHPVTYSVDHAALIQRSYCFCLSTLGVKALRHYHLAKQPSWFFFFSGFFFVGVYFLFFYILFKSLV